MPALIRRRDLERQDCRRVYCRELRSMARQHWLLHRHQSWTWGCGFYPGTDPGKGSSGTAATFDDARAAFEVAWRALLPTRTAAYFYGWRDQHDRTTLKYAMWERGELMPSKKSNSVMGSPCRARFGSHDPAGSYIHREHIYAAQAASGALR